MAQPLAERDWQIARALGPQLGARPAAGGAGRDRRLPEINVTSPTCFQEISQQSGFDVASMFIDAPERQH